MLIGITTFCIVYCVLCIVYCVLCIVYCVLCIVYCVGETGVGWDTFQFLSNIADTIYDRDFELTRQGRGILPLQTLLLKLCCHFIRSDRIRCQRQVGGRAVPTYPVAG